ncbi:MAG: pentapeptide repeat-containing protein [Planctomycetota bacterium]
MINKKEIERLRDRWSLKSYVLRKALLNPLLLPFGRTEEKYYDIRGCPINEVLHQLNLENCDFSFSTILLRGQIGGGSTFKNCLFNSCRYETTVFAKFYYCSFINSNIHTSIFMEEFNNCDFSDANLSKSEGTSVTFINCNFDHTNFKKASFYESRFIECRFNKCQYGFGSFGHSVFKMCTFKDNDWKDTILNGVSGLPDDMSTENTDTPDLSYNEKSIIAASELFQKDESENDDE